MGRWLAKFSADTPKSLTDNADIVHNVSALSPPDLEVPAKNTPLHYVDEPTPPCNLAGELSIWIDRGSWPVAAMSRNMGPSQHACGVEWRDVDYSPHRCAASAPEPDQVGGGNGQRATHGDLVMSGAWL